MKCCETIQQFQLKSTKYPIPLCFMGRKQSVDFNDTTLETWKSFIPADTYELRSGDKEIIIKDCVKIQYGGFDSSEAVKKFNSAEYAYAFIDQAEELTRDDYGLLRGTFRRKVKNNALQYKILLTANPADCWLRDEFIAGGPKENAFVRALPADNPFLPQDYVENLKEAFKHRPELIDAYVYGSWDVISGFDLIIKPGWVDSSVGNFIKKLYEKRIVSCDPARFGDDETVIYVIEDGKIIDEMIYGQKSTMETAGHIASFFRKYDANLAVVDGCGVGGGVVDRLKEIGIKTLDLNSGARPELETDREKYTNIRTQMWWEAGEMFANGDVSIRDDKELRRQLSAVKYEMSSRGQVKAEPKDKVKERLSGKSPDRADTLVMGLYALKKVPVKYNDFQRIIKPKRIQGYGWNQKVGVR